MTKKYLAFKEDVAPLAELLAEAFVKSSSSDTLTWDGDTTGLAVVDMGTVDGGTNETKTLAYHVSDAVITPADIANGFTITIKHIEDSVEQVLSFSAGDENVGIEQLTDKFVLVKVADQNIVLVVSEDNYELDGITFKKGIYYCVVTRTRVSGASETMYPISVKINGYTGFVSTTLNEECLPGIVKNAFVESDPVVSSDTITWDGKTDGLEAVSVNDRTQAYHVSDAVPTLADIEGRITLITTLTSDNEKQSLTSDLLQVKQLTEKFIGISESGMYHVFVCSEDNYEIDDLVFPKKGIYLCTTVSEGDSNDLIYPSSVTISGYKGFTTTTTAVKLNYDYLPDIVKNAFVESNSGGSDTLTWDGKTDGLLSVEIVEGIKVYHISDATPTEAEMTDNLSMACKRDTYTDGVLTGSEEIAATDLTVFSKGKLTIVDGVNMDIQLYYNFYVCAEDNYTMNEGGISCTFPKKGIYVIVYQDVNDDGATIIDYPTSIKINGYAGFGCETTVKLNEEYLPDSLTGDILVETTTDTITWDGNTNGLEYASLGSGDPTTIAYHISDAVPTDEDLINGVTSVVFASYSGKKITYDVAFESDDESIKVGLASTNIVVIICSKDNHTYEGITFPKKGIYFIRSEADSGYYYITESLTINGYTGFDTEIKLNEKYLTVIPIAKGGTGATTADGALYNLGLTASTGATKIGFDTTRLNELLSKYGYETVSGNVNAQQMLDVVINYNEDLRNLIWYYNEYAAGGNFTRNTTNTTSDYWSCYGGTRGGDAYIRIAFTMASSANSTYKDYIVATGCPIPYYDGTAGSTVNNHNGEARYCFVDKNGNLIVSSGATSIAGKHFYGVISYQTKYANT